jgi:hypothetical protein
MKSQMFNHLVLAAQQSVQMDKVELFLSYRNHEQSSCVVNWSITLPASLKATFRSKAFSGTTIVLPSEQNIVLGSWIVDVSAATRAHESEIETAATLSVGGADFKSDGTRARLSTLLDQV